MADHYKLFLAALTPAFAVCAHAQVTTSALGGLITDESGQPAVGATIRAIHTPSGTRYTATTNADGRFTIQGMRPGGPYTVQVTYLGYGTKSVDKLFLQLGDQLPFDLQLKPNESELSEAVVTAVGKSRAGAGQNFSLQKITTTPTIDRNILEVVKFSPMAISSKTGGISFVGSNNRYNSFNIDGVVANDVFGLSAGGTNGSGSGANPISMDAIQEVQVVVAPYDVRQGGFTGGGINAVTKQGTNTMHGSAYGFFNNQNMYGRYSAARDHTYNKLPTQYERTFGATLGGAFMKDKLFYFVSFEHKKSSYPSSIYPGYTDKYISAATAQQIADRYFALTGIRESFGQRDVDSRSNSFLGRLDWNIDESNKLSFRYQYNEAYRDAYGANAKTYFFNNSAYRIANESHSFVTELNSHITDALYNELRASASIVKDHREVPYQGPTVEIANVTGADGKTNTKVNIGTEFSSGANALYQRIYSLEDNLSWYLGNHTLTFGTHNEFYHIQNTFIQGSNGTWYFQTLDDFLKDNPYKFFYQYTDPTAPRVNGSLIYAPAMSAGQFGFYAQDKWNVTSQFNFTLGLRMDIPMFFNRPSVNTAFNTYADSKHFGVHTGDVPNARVMWSPRLGFNWHVDQAHRTLIRSGVGIFTGRVPFVWISNAFTNTGVEKKGTTITKSVPGMANYHQAIQDVIAAGATKKPEIAVVQKSFKYPQVFRANLAVEQTLPGNVKLQLEGIYSKTINNVFFENLALTKVGEVYAVPGVNASAAPFYSNASSAYENIINLKNTNKGYSYALSAQLEKYFDFGLDVAASYTYGRSRSVNDGTSSVAYSNWKFNYSRDTNGPGEMGYSKFDIPHRVMVRLNYNSPKYCQGWLSTSVGIVYTGTSGGRYSLTMNEKDDFNGDGWRGNNLLYIPTKDELSKMNFIASTDKKGNVTTADQARQLFEDWIQGNSYARTHRGQYAERNSCMTDWENNIDLHFGQSIHLKNLVRLEFTLDVINFTNMLNKRWGTTYGNAYNVSPIMVNKIVTTGAAGNIVAEPSYTYNPNANPTPSDIASRWHMQLGFRIAF